MSPYRNVFLSVTDICIYSCEGGQLVLWLQACQLLPLLIRGELHSTMPKDEHHKIFILSSSLLCLLNSSVDQDLRDEKNSTVLSLGFVNFFFY